MERFVTRECTRDDAAIMRRNLWKVLPHGGELLRIREPEESISSIPGPSKQYAAVVEILQVGTDMLGDRADTDCEHLVGKLFLNIKVASLRR